MVDKMCILGLSRFFHGSAACLVSDEGTPLDAAKEELFTRKKYDPGFSKNAIEYCLEDKGITFEDVNFFVFDDKPLLIFDKLLNSYLTVAPKHLRLWLKAMSLWLKQKFHISRIIEKETGYDGIVHFAEHHEAHDPSAFYRRNGDDGLT
jgi:carbamoyltransferase